MVIDDDGQLDHIFTLQLHRIDNADDVAVVSWRGGQVQYEARVDGSQGFNSQVGFEVVAFVDDNHGIEARQHLDEGGVIHLVIVSVRLGFARIFSQILILTIHAPAVFRVARKRLDAQHENGQLLLDLSRRNAVSHQCRFFIHHLNTPVEKAVDALPVGMVGILQVLEGLFQDGVGRHKPSHHFRQLGRGVVENGSQGIAGNESLAARRGHFEQHPWHTPDFVVVGLEEVIKRAQHNATVFPMVLKGGLQVFFPIQPLAKVFQVGQHFALVFLEFHRCQNFWMSRGIFLKMMFFSVR